MRDPRQLSAAYERLRALPDTMTGHLIDGEVIALPRPGNSHGVSVSRALAFLTTKFGGGRGGDGWWLVVEPEVHFGDDILVPDIAGWRTTTLPQIPDEPFMSVAPDWVCEALSPSTAGLDRVKKARVYARAGVGWYWILDPSQRTVEVHRLNDGRYTVQSTCALGERLTLEPFSTETFDPIGWWLNAEPGERRDATEP